MTQNNCISFVVLLPIKYPFVLLISVGKDLSTVEWETGEKTYEPLNAIAADDPVTWAEYAKNNILLNTDGWKQFWRIAKNEKNSR
jgi:hypothetical protein